MLSVGTDCSGIEAVLFALQNLNIQYTHEFSCEVDKHAKKSLLANFSPRMFYDNIMGRNIEIMPYVDLYVCGFPCQPFSSVGSRKGFNDTKGTIFFECFNYIKIKEPKMFLLENVKGLLTHNKGETFKTIMNNLHTLPYHIEHFKLNTKHYGIPQNRERVFIVGIHNSHYNHRECRVPAPSSHTPSLLEFLNNVENRGAECPSLTHYSPKEKEHLEFLKQQKGADFYTKTFTSNLGLSWKFLSCIEGVCPTLTANAGNFYVSTLNRKLSKEEALALQGFPPTFKIVVSRRQIYKQAGNSISVCVLTAILEEMFKCVILT